MGLFKKKAETSANLTDLLKTQIVKWPGQDKLTTQDRVQFIEELLHGDSLIDLQKRSDEEASETVRQLWKIFQERRFADIYIDIQEDAFGQADRVDITIMQRQIPFITDSILNLLRHSHLSVSVMVNATLKVRRDDDTGKLLSVHADEDYGPDLQTDKILHLQCEQRGEGLDVEELRTRISNILRDVHAAVEDWRPMQGQIADTINEMENHPSTIDKDEAYEIAQFLSYLKEGNFTFLGYREHDIRKEKNTAYFDTLNDKSLGILRDQGFLIFDDLISDELISQEGQKILTATEPPMMVLKASRLSTVHRNVQMDVLVIKRYNKKGEVDGLRLFAGLFTSQCYAQPADQIPYLKRKLNTVLKQAGYDENTHSWRALKHVLESFSRDELFQINTEELADHAAGINRLNNRPDVDVFVRRDPLQRYFSVLVYLPKDLYNTTLRLQTENILEEALQGTSISHHMTVDEKSLARLQYTISCGGSKLPDFDMDTLRARLIDACTPWFDRLKIAALNTFGKQKTQQLLQSLTPAFSVSYKDQVKIENALEDLEPIQTVMREKEMVVTLSHRATDNEGLYRIKFYKRDSEAVLSELLPTLDRMGFHCLHEYSYQFNAGGEYPTVWLHELVGTIDDFQPEMLEETKSLFADAFEVIWRGKVDSDSFNALVLAAGLTWREANMFRAFARYLDLANYPLGIHYISQVLSKYAVITRCLRSLYLARLNPEMTEDKSAPVVAQLLAEIEKHMEKVEKLDEDRVLRSVLNLIQNTLRTNYFQTDENGQPLDVLVMKFSARDIKDLPQPRPFREMFVYSTRMEAVHLRGGMIARGGIRWSDRYEDFRTEILGLVKAQQVKNAVIVPVGAKGGFICKNQPNLKTPQERQEEGIACYQIMVRSFLSITDNLVDGKIVPPKNTPRLDGDDPYLVVAADKGTASFSDIANTISLQHNFWLGDAFASGGSVGYDHKKMGITARGAWECIKRNFRELGKDIQTQDFTVAGVGDMSGDVFGNGMLLSKHIRLIAAFDHRHIFVDPNPDAAASFVERQRLFDKPGSSWMDYDPKLISKGGAVFSRQEKSLTLTPEIMQVLEIKTDRVTPNELMSAILRANVELMYFGGIGTYVKATFQSHEQVGDKTNDPIRVNASELRCHVLGEGANLPATQAARIEYAQRGGRIEPDFIDNSGGVDTSDHEVNIKILLQPMINSNTMSLEERNPLLESMTDEIAEHVLQNNYDQSLALSLEERRAVESLPSHVEFMRSMERQGLIDRKIEGLPDDETINRLLQRHQGLTRPELAVIMAYSKITLFNQLIASDLPDDEEMVDQLIEYFPTILQQKFKKEILGHKLKREIIATEIANVVINRMGPLFVANEMTRTSLPADKIVRAWLIVRSVFDLRSLWNEINKLDNVIPADLQLEMYQELVDTMSEGIKWFLKNHSDDLSFKALIPLYRDQLVQLQTTLADVVPAGMQEIMNQKQEQLNAYDAIRPDVKKRLLQLPLALAGSDVVYLAQQTKASAKDIAAIYFAMNERLHLATIGAQLESLPADTSWAQEAIEGLQDALQSMATELTIQFLNTGKPVAAINEWLGSRQNALESIDALTTEMTHVAPDLALLTVLIQRLSRFVDQTPEKKAA